MSHFLWSDEDLERLCIEVKECPTCKGLGSYYAVPENVPHDDIKGVVHVDGKLISCKKCNGSGKTLDKK